MFQHISWLWIFAPRLPQSSNQRRILWNRRCDQCRWKRCDNFLNATRKTNWRKKEMRSWGKKRCNVWVEVYKSFSPRLPICSSCRTRCKQDKLLHLENAGSQTRIPFQPMCSSKRSWQLSHLFTNSAKQANQIFTSRNPPQNHYTLKIHFSIITFNTGHKLGIWGVYPHLLLRFKGDANASTGSECGHHSLKALNTAGGIAPWLPPPGCDNLGRKIGQSLRLVLIFPMKFMKDMKYMDIPHFQTI